MKIINNLIFVSHWTGPYEWLGLNIVDKILITNSLRLKGKEMSTHVNFKSIYKKTRTIKQQKQGVKNELTFFFLKQANLKSTS